MTVRMSLPAFVLSVAVLASPSLSQAGGVIPIIDPAGSRQVTLDDGITSVTYATMKTSQPSVVAAFAALPKVSWMHAVAGDDELVLSLPATGSGAPAALSDLTEVGLDGKQVRFDTVTRKFDTEEEAAAFFAAVHVARLAPSGGSLSEAQGMISVSLDLEESWIEANP